MSFWALGVRIIGAFLLGFTCKFLGNETLFSPYVIFQIIGVRIKWLQIYFNFSYGLILVLVMFQNVDLGV